MKIHNETFPGSQRSLTGTSAENTNNNNGSGEIKELTCIHLNGQSIRGRKIEQLEAEVQGHEVVLISETWLNKEDTNESIELNGYHIPIRKDRDAENRGGGVAIYIKDNLVVKHLKDMELQGLEGAWAEVNTGRHKILLGVIYRTLGNQWELFDQAFEEAKLRNIENLLIVGDINEDQREETGKLKKLCVDYNLHQMVTEKTHDESILDVAITSNPENIKDIIVRPQSLSKHNAVIVKYNFQGPSRPKYTRRIYDYNKANWEELRESIKNTDWTEAAKGSDADERAENWTKTFTKLIEKHIPTMTVKINQNDAPWITNKLKRSMQRRDRLYKIAKLKGTDQAWRNYKDNRNEVVEEIRDAKEEHTKKWEKKIIEASSDDERHGGA